MAIQFLKAVDFVVDRCSIAVEMGLLIFDLVWLIKDFGGGELDEHPIFLGRKAHRRDWIRLLMQSSVPWRLSVSAGSRVTFGVWMPRMSFH